MLVLKRLIAFIITSVTVLAAGAALAATAGQPEPWQLGHAEGRHPGDGRHHLVPRFPAVGDHGDHAVRARAARHRGGEVQRRSNPIPSRTTHNTTIEVLWTVVPVLILVTIAVPSFRLLFFQLNMPKADVTVKATGKQWFWSYSYPDNKFEFDSLMVQDKDLKPGQPRLLAVDNEMVVPVNKVVHVLTTGADVIHSFAVPSFGIKIDAIPGRINETWFKAEREGIYYGQCSELCGKDHAFMPIVVRVVNDKDYTAWLEQAKKKYATDDSRPTAVAAAGGAN